ncbi:amino acid ABC transporter permease [Candidatus Bathyarchaeota archaeon CG_4_8_14_3_um_filter_42_8]|nr:MAG: amino acid ABC transporter permease [Candidatus Bathyarchaeota archaeon CG_4_8_14_3_um_filter_42_8]
MDFLIKYLPLILNGFITTTEMTLFGVLMGLTLGILLAIGDLHGGKLISTIIRFYVEFFRGSPIIIQLFIFYYTIPSLLNTRIDGLTVGFLVFALNSAAYQKGYIKGAMEAVFEDQMTAALSIGLSKAQAITYVILPQALRLVIPPWGNEFCSLTKSTAALLVIGVRDLTSAGKTIAGQSWRILETWTFIAIIYLIWISIVMKILDIVYEKVKIPGIEISA